MSSVNPLREFICARLTAAAQEIFKEVEKTIVQYEEEIHRQKRLLENQTLLSFTEENHIYSEESKQQCVQTNESILECQTFCSTNEEPISDQQESEPSQDEEEQIETLTDLLANVVTDGPLWNQQKNCGLDQDQADPPQIKEELKEVEVQQVKEEQHFINNQSYGEQVLLKQEAVNGTHDGCNQQTPELSNDQFPLPGPTSSPYGRHITLHTNEKKPYACNLCGKRFTYLYLVKCHVRVHTGEKVQTCGTCGQMFNVNSNLLGNIQAFSGEKTFSCNLCEMKLSQLSSPGKKPYSCEICAKEFGRRDSMLRHMITHTGERPYACTICGERFGLNSHLLRHMRVHTGEKPYYCHICHKRFTQSNSLADHLRMHSGERPYTCIECGKCFPRSGSLNVHLKIHRGEKPHSCTDCGKRFRTNYSLKHHQKTHRGGNDFSCKICGKVFERKCNLSRHHHIVHNC